MLTIEFESGAPLESLNTLALAASARLLLRAESDEAVLEAFDHARAHALPVLPWGEGSNIVLAGDIDALVLQMRTRGIEVLDESSAEVTLRVAAGENWHSLVTWTVERGYCGLENLALIPGTVGAAPIQNIGAYGVELCQYVTRVEGWTSADSRAFSLGADDCQFAYRDSIFKGELRDRAVVSALTLRLPKTAEPNVTYPALARQLDQSGEPVSQRAVYDAVVALRRERLPDPAQTPNAGSFFKNPVVSGAQYRALKGAHDAPGYAQADGSVKVPAAWLIEQCGWKGKRAKGQGVHPGHALVLVNYGNPSGADLLALADAIARDVAQTFDIALEIEPRIYPGRD